MLSKELKRSFIVFSESFEGSPFIFKREVYNIVKSENNDYTYIDLRGLIV